MCIRDRYQRRVHGIIICKISMASKNTAFAAKVLTLLFFFGTLCDIASAWSATPHMIMYAIAKKDFKQTTKDKMDKYFGYMKEKDANYHNWYELVCWPDDLKGSELGVLDGWHFYNQAFYDGIKPEDATIIINKEYNVVNSVVQTLELFKKPDNGVMFHKSFMLRYFIHMVGDMHQPLHVTSRVSQQHKDGDKGGNLFFIKHNAKNLHALWDRMMEKSPLVKRPLDQTGINAIESWADTIRKQFTREKLANDLKVKDPWVMAQKMHEIAISEAYGGIKENTEPSKDYLAFRFETCKKLIALAGYRLADFLNEHLQSSLNTLSLIHI
eukprot:TRINITY_DN484_c0_g1_i1.p1 TRINITY_DN484_c0_g1~~TRINITY_DN484_c0_g1_i1.p1  ORF type:complete len:326 (+),score=58.29 TRINITY_DN484_c0_g1_i1:67-1044(+)